MMVNPWGVSKTDRELRLWNASLSGVNRVKEVGFIRHAAVGNFRELRLRLRLGENVNQTDSVQRTALMEAARNGHEKCVKFLIKKKADVNRINCQGHTALHMAARENHAQCVKLLLDQHCQVDALSHNGFTPLMEAVRYNNMECVQILLSYGADINVSSYHGKTAIHYAAASGYEECFQLLMEHANGENMVCAGYIPPIISSIMSASKCLSILLNSGKSDVNRVDRFGENAILEASRRGQESYVRMLLQHGADVNSRSDAMYSYHRSTLMHAAQKGHVTTVQTLISYGAEINLMDTGGRTAFSLAAEAGNTSCLSELHRAGCDINRWDTEGRTALMYACQNNNLDLVIFLLNLNIGSNIKDKFGKTAYNYHTKRTDLKKLLYIAGAESDDLTDSQWTYLLDVKVEDTEQKDYSNVLQNEIDNLKENPNLDFVPTLMQFSRIAIRKHLSTVRAHYNHFHLVEKLPLPNMMLQYLLFNTNLCSRDEDKETNI